MIYRCVERYKKNISKKDLCNLLLQSNGTYPYYYVNEGITNIIYLNHISINSERGISFSSNINGNFLVNDFLNNEYSCDEISIYEDKKITYANYNKIEFPLSNNETILFKSMSDYHRGNINDKIVSENVCSILDETLKIAKPMQVFIKYFNY